MTYITQLWVQCEECVDEGKSMFIITMLKDKTCININGT